MTTSYVKNHNIAVTPRDVQVFAFIEAYIKFHGFAPLLEEIGQELKVPRQSIHRTLDRLEALGCIERKPRVMRGITPIKSPVSLNQ